MTVGLPRWFAFGVLLAGLGLAAATEAAGTNRGLTVPLRASEARGAPVTEEVTLYGASYALVIGIDNYTNGWPRLSKAVEDARAVADELRRKGFSVTLKTDLKSRALEDVLKEFYAIKGTDPEARLFLWYAGHGHTEGGEGYLVPSDAPRPEIAGLFRLKALSLRRIGEYVRLAQSKHAFAIFDSCFSGTVFQSARALPPAAVTRATTLPVRQFLTSGDAGQTVSDDGAFRELFLRALRGEERADANGDGYLTASELGLFLTDRVTNLTRSKQTPRYGKLRDKDWDRGDFVFALSKAAGTAARTQPSRPMPQASGATPEMLFWQSIQGSAIPDSFKAYLSQFPNGTFAALAKVKLKELRGRKTAAVTPPKRLSRSAATVDQCDRLAAHPFDKKAVVPGIDWENFTDPLPAVRACEQAVAAYPGELRFVFQLARAKLKSGRAVEAAGLYRRAAEQGYAQAQVSFGNRYLKGDGAPKDLKKAYFWYRKAAEQGNASAQFGVGTMYERGNGVAKDVEKAIWYLRKAAAQGHQRATKRLQRLGK